MTLAAGTKLGLYEILGPLGAGGMGEVYRARDSKLKREVAIRVLPQSLAAGSARRYPVESWAGSPGDDRDTRPSEALVGSRGLLAAQRRHRVDPHHPPRRQVTREQRDAR